MLSLTADSVLIELWSKLNKNETLSVSTKLSIPSSILQASVVSRETSDTFASPSQVGTSNG